MALAADTDHEALERTPSQVGDYVTLLKPRVMSLVIFTALVGLFVAPGGLHPVLAGTAILAIAIGAGASGALNMWYDRDIDRVMSRTRNRPLPRGRITEEEVLVFGLTLSAMSVATLGLATNWLAAGLLAFTIFFYAVIYTVWLKRSTPQNIVIGGAAGAFPPMIGWAAVTGQVGIEAWVMFAIIFLWTPPHFWALALFKKGDYEAAGVPMLPNVAGERATQNQILIYSVVLVASGIAPLFVGMAGWLYGVVAVGLGAWFLWLAFDLWRASEKDRMKKIARSLFRFSLYYLFVLFVALAADHALALYLGAAQ